MASKLKIITVNISDQKADTVALALRDMQDMIDSGWTIVGQSQYQNAVTYTLQLLDLQVKNVDLSVSNMHNDSTIRVDIPAQTIQLGNGQGLH